MEIVLEQWWYVWNSRKITWDIRTYNIDWIGKYTDFGFDEI